MDDLKAHVVQLAADLDVEVWICQTCDTGDEPDGAAQLEPRAIFLSHDPDVSVEAYLIALHELGHHASTEPWAKGLRLDHEAAAWVWAELTSLLPWGRAEWAVVAGRLERYWRDRRFKRTPRFTRLMRLAKSRSL